MPDDVVIREHPGARCADAAERGERLVDDGAQRLGGPRRLEVAEVEGLLHLVGAHPVGELRQRDDPRLGAQDAVGAVLGEHLVPVAIDLVHALLRPVRGVVPAAAHAAAGLGRVVGEAVDLREAVSDVDAEAVDAAVEPEAQDAAELLLDPLVGPVEVGLRCVEEVQVPGAGGSVGLHDAGPGGAAEDGVPVVRRQLAVLAAALAEHVARALGRARAGGERLLEPAVLARAVVRHQVDDDAQAEAVGGIPHLVEVGERAEERVDVAVVGDVVSGVVLRRGHERREPDRVDPELLERTQSARDAGQIADAVAVGVRERTRVDLVDDRGAPPVGCDCHSTSLREEIESFRQPVAGRARSVRSAGGKQRPEDHDHRRGGGDRGAGPAADPVAADRADSGSGRAPRRSSRPRAPRARPPERSAAGSEPQSPDARVFRLPRYAAERPDSSVVEHFHGKEGVVSSILTRGSRTLVGALGGGGSSPGGVAQVVRAHDS